MLSRVQNGSSTYVVYDFPSKDVVVDEISEIMINNNQDNLVGLAPIRIESINGINKRMFFDITGMVSLREYVNNRINQNSFKNMMLNLISSIENFDEYMIDVRQVLLDIDNVYINELNLKVSFICLAIKNLDQSGDLRGFFKSLVENSNVTIAMDEKDYFHCVWNVIRNESGFSLSNMKTALTTGIVASAPINLGKDKPTQQSNVPQGINQQHTVNSAKAPVVPSVDNTVTVTPTPVPNPVSGFENNLAQQAANPQEDKKKQGLFDKLFGSKKNDSAQKSGAAKDTAAKGGLASLKNGGHKKNIPAVQPLEQANDLQPYAQQPNVPNIPNAIPYNNGQAIQQQINGGGTTVLNSPMANLSSQPFSAGKPELAKQEGNFPMSGSASPVNSNMAADNGTTVLIQNPGETTVLQGNMQPAPTPYLIRYKNNERILISGPVFKIGKERSQVNYFIGDNTAISRIHAKIVVNNGSYFVVDANSTNHTFVNGTMIQPNNEIAIVNGDIIKLANEDFEFKLL